MLQSMFLFQSKIFLGFHRLRKQWKIKGPLIWKNLHHVNKIIEIQWDAGHCICKLLVNWVMHLITLSLLEGGVLAWLEINPALSLWLTFVHPCIRAKFAQIRILLVVWYNLCCLSWVRQRYKSTVSQGCGALTKLHKEALRIPDLSVRFLRGF